MSTTNNQFENPIPKKRIRLETTPVNGWSCVVEEPMEEVWEPEELGIEEALAQLRISRAGETRAQEEVADPALWRLFVLN